MVSFDYSAIDLYEWSPLIYTIVGGVFFDFDGRFLLRYCRYVVSFNYSAIALYEWVPLIADVDLCV